MRAPILILAIILTFALDTALLLSGGSDVLPTAEMGPAHQLTVSDAAPARSAIERAAFDRVVPSTAKCLVRGRVVDSADEALPGATDALRAARTASSHWSASTLSPVHGLRSREPAPQDWSVP